MKKSKFFPLFLILALLAGLLAVPSHAAADPAVAAPHALVLDGGSGAVLFAKDADARIYPASTTKIMTALLTVEAVERGDVRADEAVTAPAEAFSDLIAEGSTAGIRPGETLTVRQLLDCAMVASANEACNILAIRLAGSTAAFAARMNERAAALGCADTHFVNTHGLPDSGHSTTAADMGRIALEALRHPLFAEVCAQADVTVPATNLSPARTLANSNALLGPNGIYGSGYVYAGAVGVKTGHTSAAGYCLVAAAVKNGMRIVTCVFGCESPDACFRDSAALLDWTGANFSLRQIASATERVGAVEVRSDGVTDLVELRPVEDFSLLLPRELDDSQLTREITVYGADSAGAIPGPVASGAVLGRLELTANGDALGGVDLVPAASSALVMDRRTGEVLFAKGLDSRVYPADTVKLMTGLLAVEAVERGERSLHDMVTVTDAIEIDLDENSTRCGLQPGEQLTLEALLQCAMIASADDAANAIAEFIGGSIPDFVARMNARAAALGCGDTAYTNAHGAFSEFQYTTARDAAALATECTKHERLMRVCGASIAELPETNLSGPRTLKNTNALICDESPYGGSYVYESADGLKSGWNPGAGYALAATASRSGMDLLCVIFGGEKTAEGRYTCFDDAAKLFDWVFDNYAYQEVLKSTENIASVDVALGMDASYVNLRPATSITVLLPNDYDPAEFRKDIRVYALENRETVTAPVAAGQVLGEVTVTRDGHSYGTVKLVASSTVQLSRVQYIRQQIRATTSQRAFRMVVIVLALLFLLYLVWVLIYRIKRIRYLRAVRAAERERLLQAEASMKAAEAPRSPGIRFFNAAGVSEPKRAPKRLSDAPAPEIDIPVDEEAPGEAPGTPEEKVVRLFPDGKAAESAPEGKAPARPEIDIPIDDAPGAAPTGDLLTDAVLVASAEPAPVREETPEEKAERDYFAEFFKPKK